MDLLNLQRGSGHALHEDHDGFRYFDPSVIYGQYMDYIPRSKPRSYKDMHDLTPPDGCGTRIHLGGSNWSLRGGGLSYTYSANAVGLTLGNPRMPHKIERGRIRRIDHVSGLPFLEPSSCVAG